MNSLTKRLTGYSKDKLWEEIKKNRFIYLLLVPAFVLVLIFMYFPYWGVKIAFQDYNIFNPDASEWVGWANFIEILSEPSLLGAIRNTLWISVLYLIVGFPASIILALMLNELKSIGFKKFTQTVSYLPHFLSWISVIGIVTTLYSKSGPINMIYTKLTGNEPILFLAQQWMFVPNVIFLSVWKGIGWGSIIYLAAISGVNADLYEAAAIDGAGKFRQMWHITLPSIRPTIIIMLIWKLGGVFADNFELIYGLQNAYIDYEVIGTVMYKRGIQGGEYDISTAFGIFQGFINMSLVLTGNYISKKMTDVGIV